MCSLEVGKLEAGEQEFHRSPDLDPPPLLGYVDAASRKGKDNQYTNTTTIEHNMKKYIIVLVSIVFISIDYGLARSKLCHEFLALLFECHVDVATSTAG